MMCPVRGIEGWDYDVKQKVRAGAGGFGRWWSVVSGHGLMQDVQGLICVTSGRKVNILVGGMSSYEFLLYLNLCR